MRGLYEMPCDMTDLDDDFIIHQFFFFIIYFQTFADPQYTSVSLVRSGGVLKLLKDAVIRKTATGVSQATCLSCLLNKE